MNNNNTQSIQEPKFCNQCNNFYANPKFGNLCSKCFKDKANNNPMSMFEDKNSALSLQMGDKIESQINSSEKIEQETIENKSKIVIEKTRPIQVRYLNMLFSAIFLQFGISQLSPPLVFDI